MSQRVYLVSAPLSALADCEEAILGKLAERQTLARSLAESAQGHVRRVAVSELVLDAAERAGARGDHWDFARNCLPYVLAASDATAIIAGMTRLTNLVDREALESFFIEQVRQLGFTPRELRRDAFVEPSANDLRDWILERLNKATELRARAVREGTRDLTADAALSTWIWLTQIFSRVGPCFWQGRDRWLGHAAFPERFIADPLPAVFSLRSLLVSTAVLTERLAMPGWPDHLAPEGSGYVAAGAVKHEDLVELRDVLAEAAGRAAIPYAPSADWVAVVTAASMYATSAKAHLVEADDAFAGGYRWPFIDD